MLQSFAVTADSVSVCEQRLLLSCVLNQLAQLYMNWEGVSCVEYKWVP